MKQHASYAIRRIRGSVAELEGADQDAKQMPGSLGTFRAWHELRLPCALAAHPAGAAQLAAKL